jgi:hypothetical protein
MILSCKCKWFPAANANASHSQLVSVLNIWIRPGFANWSSFCYSRAVHLNGGNGIHLDGLRPDRQDRGAAREPQERTQGETATLVLVSRNHRSSGNPDALSGHSQSEADRDSLGADRETPRKGFRKNIFRKCLQSLQSKLGLLLCPDARRGKKSKKNIEKGIDKAKGIRENERRPKRNGRNTESEGFRITTNQMVKL